MPSAGSADSAGSPSCCDGHVTDWAHLWERLSIEFDDFTDELRILRLHLLHLLQTVSPNTAGPRCRGAGARTARRGIPRTYLLGRAVHLPGLNLRLPMVTRSLLGYRYRRLPEARHAATAAGYAGAMFPWQSGSDGREESQRLHLNPRSGRWNPDSSARAHHIGIAVAYSAWKFYQVTGDLAYLIDYGAEMLAEIARFWVSLATYDEERDRYGIRGVIGPDEFHSGYPDAPYDGIDNNAYTNVMAVWVIMRALDALNLLPLPNRLDLLETLGLRSAELAHWDEVSRRMYVPFHDGIISQFEGYGELAELDWDRFASSTATSNAWTASWRPRRRRQPLQGVQAGRRADAALPAVGRPNCASYSSGSATASCPTRCRTWWTTTWPAPPTDPRSAASCTPGCSPGPTATARWSSSSRR